MSGPHRPAEPHRPLDMPLDRPLDAPCHLIDTPVGRVAVYRADPPAGAASGLPPLVLVHSVNAAASVAEVAPLFEHYRQSRPVLALDLPGYGHSDRPAIAYTPRHMTDALHAVIASVGGPVETPVDLLGVSLGSEFVVRAAVERPGSVRRVALVTPTGLSGRRRRHGPPGTTLAMPWLQRWLAHPTRGEWLFRQLTRPGVIRYFLRRTFGSPTIDERLWAAAVATARQPGARHAPLSFISGGLFSADINTLYEQIEVPVWASLATRGDFTDFRGRDSLAGRPGWRFETVPGGALPYFADLAAFTARLDPFWREA